MITDELTDADIDALVVVTLTAVRQITEAVAGALQVRQLSTVVVRGITADVMMRATYLALNAEE